MDLKLFNKEILKNISIVEYIPKIEYQFANEKPFSVNVIFVKSEYIKELNREYRDIDAVTDVLSFNIDGEGILGEIYICPEYVKSVHPELSFKEEILRLIIHGILHLLGYDHSVEFNDDTKLTEEMFVKQEEILQNILL